MAFAEHGGPTPSEIKSAVKPEHNFDLKNLQRWGIRAIAALGIIGGGAIALDSYRPTSSSVEASQSSGLIDTGTSGGGGQRWVDSDNQVPRIPFLPTQTPGVTAPASFTETAQPAVTSTAAETTTQIVDTPVAPEQPSVEATAPVSVTATEAVTSAPIVETPTEVATTAPISETATENATQLPAATEVVTATAGAEATPAAVEDEDGLAARHDYQVEIGNGKMLNFSLGVNESLANINENPVKNFRLRTEYWDAKYGEGATLQNMKKLIMTMHMEAYNNRQQWTHGNDTNLVVNSVEDFMSRVASGEDMSYPVVLRSHKSNNKGAPETVTIRPDMPILIEPTDEKPEIYSISSGLQWGTTIYINSKGELVLKPYLRPEQRNLIAPDMTEDESDRTVSNYLANETVQSLNTITVLAEYQKPNPSGEILVDQAKRAKKGTDGKSQNEKQYALIQDAPFQTIFTARP